jgi:hypothetical protein
MTKSLLFLSLCAAAAWSQSITVHGSAGGETLQVSDLDSIVFRDVTDDDATMVAYTKSGSPKTWKTKAVDSIKTAGTGPADTGRADVGLRWMFLGDSQTGGRASGEVLSHVTAFRAIWDRSFPDKANEAVHVDGQSGRHLAATEDHYESRSERGDRTWVHFQESGGQDGAGQTSAAQFGVTFEAFVRKIKAQSPNAIISTETAFSFGRESESGRDWGPYNSVQRQKVEALAEDGIKVYVAEVDRDVKALDALVGAGNVWFQRDENNAYHYKGLGNLLVALSIYKALGYDVNALDLSGITSVSAADKAKCLEVINRD